MKFLGIVRDLNFSRTIKRLILITTDFLMLFTANLMSFYFLKIITVVTVPVFLFTFICSFICYLLIAYRLNVFSVLTRFTSYQTISMIILSISLSYLIVTLISIVFLHSFSHRFLFLSIIFSSILCTFPRIIWRGLYEYSSRQRKGTTRLIRTLVFGAGGGGAYLLEQCLKRERI